MGTGSVALDVVYQQLAKSKLEAGTQVRRHELERCAVLCCMMLRCAVLRCGMLAAGAPFCHAAPFVSFHSGISFIAMLCCAVSCRPPKLGRLLSLMCYPAGAAGSALHCGR